MRILLDSPDPSLIQPVSGTLASELRDAGLAELFEISEPSSLAAVPTKGDPVTLATVILTAVGAGGALTAALGKEGFLSRLARVLETWVGRKLEVTLETEDGRKVHLSGSAAHIERILKDRLG